MKREMEIKNAAKYLKVSEETFNKFIQDCNYKKNSGTINIEQLNRTIINRSLKNLKKDNKK